MIYCLDTSALINPWHKNYPIRHFPGLWENLSQEIEQSNVILHMEVLKEIEKQEDDLTAWAKQHSEFFAEIDEDTETVLREIVLARFPNLVDHNRDRSGADPWVIALAMTKAATVVSDENTGKKSYPKIPDVCRALSLRHIRVVEMIKEMNWVFQ